jgi:hypothetical protein
MIWKSPLKHRRSFSQKLFNHQKHLKHSNNQFVSYGQSPNLQSFFGILCASLGFERRVAIFPMVSPFWWPPSLFLQTLVENLVEPWVVFSLSFYFLFFLLLAKVVFYFYFLFLCCCLQGGVELGVWSFALFYFSLVKRSTIFLQGIFFQFFLLFLIGQIKHAPNKKLRHNQCKKDSHWDNEISTFHTSTCKEGDSIYT